MATEEFAQLRTQVATLERSVIDLNHTSKNLRNQITGLYKENSELKAQITHQSEQIDKLVELLSGDEHGANIGYFKRVQKLELMMKWLDNKKAVAVGISIALSFLAALVGFFWMVAQGIMKAVEFAKHTTIIK
jgi:predicted RNase H-like nuclease (RuvC/YqgF family)